MENTEIVGASWGNGLITGHPEVLDSSQTDMRVRAPLMTECGAIAKGLEPCISCRLWAPSKYRKCLHLKFKRFCDCI